MKPFLVRWLVTTFSVFVTAPFVGIRYEGLDTLLAASLLLVVVNAFVRPLLLLLSLPFILATLGFFILVVNALMLEVVSFLLPSFHVPSLGRAFFGAILISLVSWLVSAFFRGSDGKVPSVPQSPATQSSATQYSEMKQVKGRVIR